MTISNKLLTISDNERQYVDDLFEIQSRHYTVGGSGYAFNSSIPEAHMVWSKKRDGSGHWLVSDVYDSMHATSPTQWMLEDTGNATTYGWRLTHYPASGSSAMVTLTGIDNHASHDSFNFIDYYFGKAEGFFTSVEYTGTGAGEQQVPHDLKGEIGAIIIKCTSATGTTAFYHCETGDFGNYAYSYATTNTNAKTNDRLAVHAKQTSEYFTVKNATDFDTSPSVGMNNLGATYKAYIFGKGDVTKFGPNANERIIKCGSFIPNGSGIATLDLGFKPQWILIRPEGNGYDTMIWDMVRGMPYNGNPYVINASSFSAELGQSGSYNEVRAEVDSLRIKTGVGNKHLYIAIAEPHKPVRDQLPGNVFSIEQGSNVTGRPFNSFKTYNTKGETQGWPIDLGLIKNRAPSTNWNVINRVGWGRNIGSFNNNSLYTNLNSAYTTFNGGNYGRLDDTRGLHEINTSPDFSNYIGAFWHKCPGFFDAVGYIGDGTGARKLDHSLGVKPEMVWIKATNTTYDWVVWHKDLDPVNNNYALILNGAAGPSVASSYWGSTAADAATNDTFSLGNATSTNGTNLNFVAFMFASHPGVSQVGSYVGTGTGGATDIDCGFTDSSPRFFMARAVGAGDWYMWENAVGGITISSNPYMTLNTTDGPQSDNGWVRPLSNGFRIENGNTPINTNGVKYIYYIVS